MTMAGPWAGRYASIPSITLGIPRVDLPCAGPCGSSSVNLFWLPAGNLYLISGGGFFVFSGPVLGRESSSSREFALNIHGD